MGNVVWVSRDSVTTPQNGVYQLFVDYWWAVDKDGNLGMYKFGNRLHPQCNQNKVLTESVASQTCKDGYVGVEKIPVAYIKWDD